jgi:tetratricopeptide (TPR) repeat protein
MGAYGWVIEGDIPKGMQYYKEALQVAEEIKHAFTIVLVSYLMGCSMGHDCQWEEANYHFKRALDLTRHGSTPWGIVTTQSTMAIYQTDFKLAYEMCQEALMLAEKSEDIYSKVLAYTYHGWVSFWKGLLEEAADYLLKGAEYCDKISAARQGFDVHMFLGHCYLETRDYEESKNHANKAIAIARSAQYSDTDVGVNQITKAMAMAKADEPGIDLESLYACEAQNKIKRWSGLMRRHIGFVLLHMDDQPTSDAESWIQRAIEADQKNGTNWDLAKDYDLYADWYQRKGDLPRAQENLHRAIEIFRECEADGWVTRTEEKLARL